MTAVVGPGAAAAPSEAVVAPDDRSAYAGFVTRNVAFVVDALVIDIVGIVTGAVGVLVVSLLHLPHDVKIVFAAIGGVLFILWSILYFVVFWCTTGQTPGARLMKIRVIGARDGRIRPRTALLRCVGVVLAALPLFAGFFLILFDSRRRGFQDRFAHTLVVYVQQSSVIEMRRLRRRAEAVDPLAARRPPPADGPPPTSTS